MSANRTLRLAPPPGRPASPVPLELVSPVRSVDARLRRERIHRRAVVAMARRLLRVAVLHLTDGAALVLAAWAASSLGAGFASARPYIPALVAISLLSLNAFSAYQAGDARRDERRLLQGLLLALLTLGSLTLLVPELRLPSAFLAAFGAMATLALLLERQLIDLTVRQVYLRGFGLRRALVVGTRREAEAAMAALRDGRNVDQHLVGHVSPDEARDGSALARLSALPEVLDRHDIQEVILAGELERAPMQRVIETCFARGVSVFVQPSLLRMVPGRVEPQRVGRSLLLHVYPARVRVPTLPLKRLFDLVVAGALVVALSPLLLLIALAIRLDTPGPAFFRQERIGLGGRRFRMWKFRSMVVDAEAREKELAHLSIYGGKGTFKLRHDPRVTRVGRLLRRTSLDELPQLFNVLTGEMSLVGPRPALVADIDRYEPHHFERLSVVPGMTGPWQVGGRNLVTDFEAVVRLEREYIRRWSLGLDLKILLRTVRVVVTGEGAY